MKNIKFFVVLFYITSILGAVALPFILAIFLFRDTIPIWYFPIAISVPVLLMVLFIEGNIISETCFNLLARADKAVMQKKINSLRNKHERNQEKIIEWEQKIAEEKQILKYYDGTISVENHIALQREYQNHRIKLQEWREALLAEKERITEDLSAKSYALDKREKSLVKSAEEKAKIIIEKAEQERIALVSTAEAKLKKLERDIDSKQEVLSDLYKSIEGEAEYLNRIRETAGELEQYMKALSGYSLIDVDHMDGHIFEYWCADLLRKNGFTDVSVTQGSGDQGVDVLAKKDGIKYAIQCKCYSSDLGNAPIQEVHAGKAFYGCQVGAVMTNRHFTKGAQELSDKTGVLLWDRDTLEKMLNT